LRLPFHQKMFSLLASALLLATTAYAHASMQPPVSAGSYSQANVRVPHGCNKSATLRVIIQIPQGVGSVKPTRVFGWRLQIDQRQLPVPVTTESGTIDQEVDIVTYSEGNLPDNEYQDFGLTFKLPPSEDGTKFYFPVIQDCGNGLWTNWTEIPKDGNKPRYPAPALTVMKNGTLALAEVKTAASSKSSALSSASNLVMTLICFLTVLSV
jgi:periplasmic copper chaperone A